MEQLDSMDELIGILNNKGFNPPNKTILKPIVPENQADVEFKVTENDDSFEEMPTQKHFYKKSET